ncbi:PqqD family protein [Thermoflavimicrobium daqui]|uniref:PqqD family protein n=1 Tax=Thermoflavimicrobium daqui TaxID=2137476 RepID=A0A364K7T5_9BACL|nr:PqqD family protein [Thermoflavimicrobium daqui]RAL26359.1 PqqD family protein [Thermoflavimicrobium daqui]
MSNSFLKKKGKENVLDKIPVLKELYQLESIDEETVQVVIPRTSFIERLSVRFLKQPSHIRVRLDRLGSFVIGCCDGKHRVEEIQEKLIDHFGEEAEPVLPRLVQFLQIMEVNGWITWKEAD